MATNPPFEVEDQTDEDFFDKLVDDDDVSGGGSGGFKAAEVKAGDCADGKDSDEAKLFANLSLSEGGKRNDNSETKGEFGDGSATEQDCSAKENEQVTGGGNRLLVSSDSFSFGDVVIPKDTRASANISDDVEGWEWGVQGEGQLDGEANCLNSFSFDNGAIADARVTDSELKSDLKSGDVDGSATSAVKEVQWSSFAESASHGINGFGSYSDFFTDLREGDVANFDDESKVTSNNGVSNASTSEGSYSYLEYLGEFTSAVDQNLNEQHLKSSQYWENLYPGWKYDPNSGQWYQLTGYDAMTNMQHNIDAAIGNSQGSDNAAVGNLQGSDNAAVGNLQGSFDANANSYWAISDGKSSQVSYLHQSAQFAVGTVSQTEEVTNWNQVSQGNSEYPAHMIFDPQYPGWYYDTIAQEWRSLEAYHSTAQLTFQSHNQQSQNSFTSAATYSHGHDNSSSHYGSLGHSSQGLQPNLSGSLTDNSQQAANTWESKVLHGSNAVPHSGGDEPWENSFGSNSYSNNHVVQQKPLSSTGILTSYEKSSQGFDNSSWDSSLSTFVPNGSSFQKFGLPQKVEPKGPLQYSADYYGGQKPDSVSQQLLPNGHHSYAPDTGRSSAGRPPHALVTFGFGGKLIVMKDNANFGNSLHDNKDAGGHPISVINLIEVVKEKAAPLGIGTGTCNYFNALCHQSFPGPLVGGNVGNKELNKWIDESISKCESPYADYSNSDVLKLLLSLLKIAFQHYGKLRTLGADTALRESDLPETAVANLFASAKKRARNFGQYNASGRCLINLPSEAQIQKTAYEVQDLLVSGRKKEALQRAEEGQLWEFALILARELDEQFYTDTVKKMALSQLVAGTPLRTLCLLIAKKPEAVFSINTMGGVGLPGSVHMTPQPSQFVGHSMLDNWEENLAVITANRTDNDHLVITHLGDSLWKERNDITAAHICYLAAEADFKPYSDSARLCLIGGDHWNFPRTYASPEAIQRTELYEYSKVLGNSQFVLVPFQPYKLVYANMLAEVGKVSDSLRYCQALHKTLKTGRSPEADTLKQLVVSLEERIRTHQQGGYGVNLAPAKIVGKLLNFFDSTAHRVVGGLPPSAPSATQSSTHGYEQHNQMVGPKVSSSQSTMAMSSLMPSASLEPISQWTVDSNRMTVHNRSVSEPVIGSTPTQDHVDSSNDKSSSNLESKSPVSAGSSRFSRFNFGAQLLQKTVGLVLKPRQGRQAKLGEANKFYYDEKLKRWVEEGAEPPAEEAAPPPPPTTAAFQNSSSDNLKNAFNEAQPVTDSSPESRSSSTSGSDVRFPAVPPSSNQFSARGMAGVRSRYVDTFNKGGGSPANLFQTPSVLSAKPASAGSAKFFIPTVPPSNELVSDSVTGSMEETFESKENPSVAPSSSSATMYRFPSADSIPNQGMMDSVNGPLPPFSRRTASWSGHTDTFSPPEMAKVTPSVKTLGMSPLSYVPTPSSDNLQIGGGNLSDDLHEVEL
ncbi:hypothetical protein Ancab_015944 [Ancistrocladus abbreviatus]